ncbi:MAG: hypothetical protein UH241_03815 [Acutalibacteraceae bacterium]|nr:hypothetical protein [Acutalibacteraceae bacterium]
MKKTRCPYCGKRLNYFQAFAERKRGEHTCNGCGRNSTIYFSKSYKFLIAVAILLSVVLVVISINSFFVIGLWGMLWVALPFLLLYLVTPFFERLVPIKKKNSFDVGDLDSSLQAGDSTQIMKKSSGPSFNNNDDDEYFDISDLNI